jgi:hypothetical protein
MNILICPYCNEQYNSTDTHTDIDCIDVIIHNIIKKLEYLDVYILKNLYNYILTL